jgi:hypothetical protein
MLETLTQCVLILDIVVASAVADLGHADFHRRENASQVLPRFVNLATWRVDQATRCSDLEVVRRAVVIRDDIQRARADCYLGSMLASNQASLPWIDMLPPNFPDRQATILRFLDLARRADDPPSSSAWPEYRRATFYLIRELWQSGRSEAEVASLLDLMAQNERQWQRSGAGGWAGHRND